MKLVTRTCIVLRSANLYWILVAWTFCTTKLVSPTGSFPNMCKIVNEM